jgi:phage terminase small subunit
MPLTPKQETFCAEYLIDLNATRAATRAGYSARTANEQGARLLANVSVAERIRQLQQERAKRVELNQDWVLERLKSISDRCMTAEPVMKFDYDEKEMVQEEVTDLVTGKRVGLFEFDSAGANKATELIGKHLGMFTQKIDAKVETNQPIADDQVDKIINAIRATKTT